MLARPARGRTPAEVLRAIAGAQSQEPRAGRLQVRARSTDLTAEEVERARIEERSIIRHWLMRGTVHLIPTEDLEWMEPLFKERMLGSSVRRLEQLGVSEPERERALKAIGEKLGQEGRLQRAEAMAIAARTGLEIDVERRTHLIVTIVMSGMACIGPDEKGGNTLAARREWLGEPGRVDRAASLAELARRYFAAFAPATERDFAKWSGLPLGECRAGMKGIATEIEPVGALEHALYAPTGFDARVPRSPVVRLLGAFDTYLMGYESRAHAVDEAGERVILPGGGVLRPTICVNGRFVGTWSRQKKTKALLTVKLEPFADIDESWLVAIEREAVDIARFEGIDDVAIIR